MASYLDAAPLIKWIERKIDEYGSVSAFAEQVGRDLNEIQHMRTRQRVRDTTVDSLLTREGSTSMLELYDDCPVCDGQALDVFDEPCRHCRGSGLDPAIQERRAA